MNPFSYGSNNSSGKNITLFAMALGFYLTLHFLFETISLVSVGLFYGLLNSRYRKVLLLTCVTIESIFMIISLPRLYGALISVPGMFGIVNSSIPTSESITNKLNELLVNPWTIPPWANVIAYLVIISAFVFFIVTSIHYLIFGIFVSSTFWGYAYIIKILFYPMLSLNELVEMFANSIVLGNGELLGLFLPYFIIFTILYSVIIPLVTYRAVKWMGFYKRLPVVVI